jgi:hypothetical protein
MYGEYQSHAVLTEDKVRQIRRLLAEGQHTQRAIGAMFRVSRGAVKDIKYGRSWGWVE